MQLMAPHEENYGQKARILDAAIRYAHQRIARFAFGTVLGNNYSAAYGHVRSCYLQFFSSLAVCVRDNMLTKPISVQLGCSHLIGGHRLVRWAAAFSMPKGFVRAFDHTRFSHTQMFEKTLVFETALLAARGCRKKLKPFLCQSCLFAAAMECTRTVVRVTKGRPGGEKAVCTNGCRQTADFTSTESSEITCTLDQRCQIELDTPLRVLALEPLNKTQRQ